MVAAALAVGASITVTSNVRHFKPLPEGLVAMTPDAFLLSLLAAFPEEVVETIGSQAARYTNPRLTPAALLARLEKPAQKFAVAAAHHFDAERGA